MYKRQALESETLAVFSSLTPDFYDGTEVQTFRLYYDDGLTFQTIEKSENNQHRFLLHYQLGEDAQGNYLDVTIEPAYRMSLGQDALFTAIFSGQGEVQWVDLSANS